MGSMEPPCRPPAYCKPPWTATPSSMLWHREEALKACQAPGAFFVMFCVLFCTFATLTVFAPGFGELGIVLGTKVKAQAVEGSVCKGQHCLSVWLLTSLQPVISQLLKNSIHRALCFQSAEEFSLTWLSLLLQLQCCIRLLLCTIMTILHLALRKDTH